MTFYLWLGSLLLGEAAGAWSGKAGDRKGAGKEDRWAGQRRKPQGSTDDFWFRFSGSNAQGIENPGFEASPSFQGMSEAKPRPPLTYMAQRQPSESGRHLLSEPSTPLSPPGPGDVFFPSLGECFPTLAALWPVRS